MILEIKNGFEVDVLTKDFIIDRDNVSIIKDMPYEKLYQAVYGVIKENKRQLPKCETIYFADCRQLTQIAFDIIYKMREKGELPETLTLMVEEKGFDKYYDDPDEEGTHMSEIRKLADAVRLDFDEYIIKTTNPVAVPDDEKHHIKRFMISDHMTYNVNTKDFC